MKQYLYIKEVEKRYFCGQTLKSSMLVSAEKLDANTLRNIENFIEKNFK